MELLNLNFTFPDTSLKRHRRSEDADSNMVTISLNTSYGYILESILTESS